MSVSIFIQLARSGYLRMVWEKFVLDHPESADEMYQELIKRGVDPWTSTPKQ